MNCCEVLGGSNGIALHNLETGLRFSRAPKCSIFANPSFTIGPESVVYNCGAYGIKGRIDWRMVGRKSQ